MIDVQENRDARKWSKREQIGRFLWSLARPLFFLSPRPLWGWRRTVLRLFGAKIGPQVNIYPTVKVTIPWNLTIGEQSAVGDHAILYALGPINIGPRVTVSQGSHFCGGTHDWRDPKMPLVKLPIGIGADAWVCADAFIGPGIVVGEGAIVGARAVALRNIPAAAIVLGNPAEVVAWRHKNK